MKTKLSLVASSLLLVTGLQADTSNLQDALKNGKISGEIALFSQHKNKKGNQKDFGYSMGSVGLNYESQAFHNFKMSLGFRANHDFDEVTKGDYSNTNEPKAILNIANLSYSNEFITLILGRQPLSLEWVGDYHEALVAIAKPFANTEITLGHSDRIGVADNDGALHDFQDINEDGFNFVDVKYTGIESLSINPYFYNVKDVADWYGAKIEFNNKLFSATAHYAKSKEDALTKDGDILHVEAKTTLVGLSMKAGYITTNKDVGAGSMVTFDDNISPLGDGNKVYDADADTTYVGLKYPIDNLTLETVYGETKYGSDKEKELDLRAKYKLTKNTKISAKFRHIDAQDSNDDYNKIKLLATYSF